jgi:GNAT superfamily N-acetyltransferase
VALECRPCPWDAAWRPRVHALFEAVWPGFPARLAIAERLGADWHAVSRPFVAVLDGLLVAHVGVLEIPLVLTGVPTTVAGIHAVGTHPEHRGRGACRALLAHALAYAEGRAATQQLTTEVPRVFVGAGFRSVPETCFEVGPRRLPPAPVPLRRLSADAPADVGLLSGLLATRTPVSHWLGVGEPGWLFVIDEVLACSGFARLYHAADLGAVVVLEVRDGALRLYDVVAPELPPLAEIAARVPEPFERIELLFSPDRFDVPVTAVREAYPGDHLMVRGPYPPEAGRFALPLLARC